MSSHIVYMYCLLFQNRSRFLRSHEIILEAVATDHGLNQTIYNTRMWFHFDFRNISFFRGRQPAIKTDCSHSSKTEKQIIRTVGGSGSIFSHSAVGESSKDT